MHDRKMVKWAPFNSVVNTKKICYEIQNKKNYIKIPTLSQDQLNEIENNILSAYYSKCYSIIKYYYMGKIYSITSKIKYIDKIKHQIILSNGNILSFNQIINVKNI